MTHTKTTEHTPTPEYWIDDEGNLAHGHGENYQTVAEFIGPHAALVHANHITSAANGHNPLVEVLSSVMPLLKRYDRYCREQAERSECGYLGFPEIDAAEKLLSAARGGV